MTHLFNFDVVPLDQVPTEDSHMLTPPAGEVVLIVDDERIIADTLTIILERSGYTVMTAYDGQSALKLGLMTSPALVLTDVMMPGMSGIDLAIAMRSIAPECKVLLFSGQATTNDLLEEARHLGHDFRLISKPMHPAHVLRTVSQCLAFPEISNTVEMMVG
jgi:DNA-binding NtrC family response regulator